MYGQKHRARTTPIVNPFPQKIFLAHSCMFKKTSSNDGRRVCVEVRNSSPLPHPNFCLFFGLLLPGVSPVFPTCPIPPLVLESERCFRPGSRTGGDHPLPPAARRLGPRRVPRRCSPAAPLVRLLAHLALASQVLTLCPGRVVRRPRFGRDGCPIVSERSGWVVSEARGPFGPRHRRSLWMDGR